MTRSHAKKDNDFQILESLLNNSSGEYEEREKFKGNIDNDIKSLNARTKNSNITRDSKSRSKIALILTWSFVALVGIIIILGPIYNATIGINSQIDICRFLEVFHSVFGVVLAFVLGYYFKNKGDNKND